MIVAKRPGESQPFARPLVLHVERSGRDVGVHFGGTGGHRQLVRHAVVHAVVQPEVVLARVGKLIVDELREITELGAVTAGHIRGGGAPVVHAAVGDVPVVGAIGQIRDVAVERAPGRALLGHRDHQIAVLEIRFGPVIQDQIRAEAGFVEQAARRRRCPRRLLDAGWRLVVAAGFRREVVVARAAAVGAQRAVALLVPVEVELVPRRGLPREPCAHVFPAAVGLGLMTFVRHIEPRVEIAGVAVMKYAADEAMVALVARCREEPQTIPSERTADREARVPDPREGVGRPKASPPDLVVEIVALHRAVGPVREATAGEAVAALPRHEVHGRARILRFAEAAGG